MLLGTTRTTAFIKPAVRSRGFLKVRLMRRQNMKAKQATAGPTALEA